MKIKLYITAAVLMAALAYARVQTQPPILRVDAGPDIRVTGIFGQSTPFTLNGTVRLNGQLAPNTPVKWDKLQGPGSFLSDEDRPVTTGHVSLPGTYTLRLSAQDDSPHAWISNPQHCSGVPCPGASYKSQATIRASATDDVAVTKMELYADGVLLPATTQLSGKTATAYYVWNLSPKKYAYGPHLIEARAYDATGRKGWDILTILKVK